MYSIKVVVIMGEEAFNISLNYTLIDFYSYSLIVN